LFYRRQTKIRSLRGLVRSRHCGTAVRAARIRGQIHVMHARRSFDEALKLDRHRRRQISIASTCCCRRRKESARHGVANLLASAANDWNVHMVAGMALRGDGMYEEALQQFSRALKLNPPTRRFSTTRARVYHYENQIELGATSWKKVLHWSAPSVAPDFSRLPANAPRHLDEALRFGGRDSRR